ncbi:MAG: hypothetical protein WBP26_04150 [Candidatus Saccharimonadales bacterium]
MPANNKSQLLKKLLLIGVGVLLLIGVVFAVLAFMPKGIALEKYEGEGYSLLVPKEYERDESGSTTTFDEKTDDSDTKSTILVLNESFGSKLTESQKDEVLGYFDNSAESILKNSITTSDSNLKNLKNEKITHDGSPARRITAEVENDGKITGNLTMLITITDNSTYIVGVLVHSGDKALGSSVDKIIGSFNIE